MNINFNEKQSEYYAPVSEYLPVKEMPKFKAARAKAVEIIESGKYNLTDADFWILMNANKQKDKMLYSGLIISHNGCLKINDALSDKFKPSCVSIDKQGYNSSLVYTYCNDEQGIYEVGEVSQKNCKNEYPYAMAYKRLFDRVVLKLSKIAYDGIYSEAESDEFKQQYSDAKSNIQLISEADVKNLVKLLKEKGITQKSIGEKFSVKSLKDLTAEQYEIICNSLTE